MYMRRFFAFVISAFLIFFPVYSYATTSTGGWTALDTITAGATNTINATKTVGGKVLNSAVTVGASASKVGKHLIKGGGQAALAYAVVELLEEGIDWVLDPANNAVKYKPNTSPGSVGGSGQYYYVNGAGTKFASVEAGCRDAVERWNIARPQSPISYVRVTDTGCYTSLGLHETYTKVSNPAYDPSNPDGYKYLPIDTVAAKVISNAEAGHAPSQEAVKAAALEGFAAGEHDVALESAAVESDAGTENPPDTADPNNPPAENPPFDDTGIIAAINSLKALLAGILSSITGMADSVTSLFDWTQEEPPEEEAPVPVPYGELGDVGLDGVDRYEERINFSGQCPANDFSFSMLGVTYSKPIPYEHLCRFLIALAPWLLAMTYLGTAYFVVENT